jgi:NAD(P)-dependent dehydrogenase (short-subunit alcohol dehydrogenase family)
MIARGGGSIVNVGSTASLMGMPRMSAYATAKNALVGLTKTAALEYGDRQVRVNLVCPGSFHTPMSDRLYGADMESLITSRTPLRRVGGLDEIADPIVWLCSDSSSFVTGAVLSVDGGRVAGPMANPTS